MENIEESTTNDILFYIKQLEADYESLKIRLINDFDKLVEMENTYNRANQILVNRLKK